MGIHDRLSLAEEQEIIRLYREEKASVKDIVNQVNRGEKTVYRLLKRENIPRHSRKEPRWKGCDNEALVEMYLVKLMDTKEIAQQFGVSHSTIGNRLKDAGIQLRSTGVPGAMLRSGERGAQGLSRHPLYQTWNAMIQRCCVPSNKSWPNYGGAGVSVCDRWRIRPQGFANFLEDMGEKPPGTSLDRIDPFGNYEPSNCRWATSDEQAANKRGSKENIQHMMAEIEMWRTRVLQLEEFLADIGVPIPLMLP